MILRVACACLCWVCGTLTASASDWPAPVMQYLRELARIEASPVPESLEPLFAMAGAVQDRLLQIEDDRTWIEAAAAEDYDDLRNALRGLQVSRGYDIYAQRDPEFFWQLARSHGLTPDRAFFAVYRQSWGDDLVPRYLRLTSRVAPCVRFGENVMPDLYAAWRGFRADFPQSGAAYAAYADQSVADIEEAMALGTCACGDADSVERALSGFVNRFPDTPVARSVLDRLQQIEDAPDRVPVNCR